MTTAIVAWWLVYNASLIFNVALDFTALEDCPKTVATVTASAFFWVYTGLLLLPFASMSVHEECPQIVMFNYFEVVQSIVLFGAISLPLIGGLVVACFVWCSDEGAMGWMFLGGSYACTIFCLAFALIVLQVYLGGVSLIIPGLDFRVLFYVDWSLSFAVKISAIRILLFTIWLLSATKDLTSALARLAK
mmetsp:Transcript_37680/g.84280  ORF Transcript_37680/g.84280 Transcript_37680/m.84280 type:complete len:190 (-) Transcript_37680:98-667(-)